MILEKSLVSALLWIIVELGIGYLTFYIIGVLILIPNKNKLQNVVDKEGQAISKKEIKKASNIVNLVWTIVIAIINVFILIT